MKVALVTGGAQGIGKGIASLLAARGYRVAAADRDAEAGRDLDLPDVAFVRCDVSREASVKSRMRVPQTKHAAPHLRAARGAVVNIASTRALQSEPDSESHAASKGGFVALSHAMALSLGPQVRVNCVSPGWIDVSGEWKKRSRGGRSSSRVPTARSIPWAASAGPRTPPSWSPTGSRTPRDSSPGRTSSSTAG